VSDSSTRNTISNVRGMSLPFVLVVVNPLAPKNFATDDVDIVDPLHSEAVSIGGALLFRFFHALQIKSSFTEGEHS